MAEEVMKLMERKREKELLKESGLDEHYEDYTG